MRRRTLLTWPRTWFVRLLVHVSIGLLLGFAVTANHRRAVGDVLTYGAINEARPR